MSGVDKCSTIDVIGGTYKEICLEPVWEQIYGSGLRASLTVCGLDEKCSVVLHTIAGKEVNTHLEMHYNNISKEIVNAPQDSSPISFVYQNALKPPLLFHKPLKYPQIDIKVDNCIMFGMMECVSRVVADYVVYDPQSPNAPIPFSKTRSLAKHLCIVMNQREAKLWTGKDGDEEIRDFIFSTENCECLVIKKGAEGALLFDAPNSKGTVIPLFKTNHVWKIGSGDVFTGAFGYYWIVAHETPEECALKASRAVACYSNSKTLDNLNMQMETASFKAHLPKETGSVYLAGPFFTMAERMFVNECREALLGIGLSVFSPFHDVGFGEPDEVVPQDIEAIKRCKTIFAILNGMDPGTVFEVGFGVALGKNIVVLAECETKSNLQMIRGTNCVVETDFVTAIYKTSWLTNE